jgi:hypothetical protein
MTATLLAANAAWIGLVMALWTKRLWETQARIRRSMRMRMRKDQLLGFLLKLDWGLQHLSRTHVKQRRSRSLRHAVLCMFQSSGTRACACRLTSKLGNPNAAWT